MFSIISPIKVTTKVILVDFCKKKHPKSTENCTTYIANVGKSCSKFNIYTSHLLQQIPFSSWKHHRQIRYSQQYHTIFITVFFPYCPVATMFIWWIILLDFIVQFMQVKCLEQWPQTPFQTRNLLFFYTIYRNATAFGEKLAL